MGLKQNLSNIEDKIKESKKQYAMGIKCKYCKKTFKGKNGISKKVTVLVCVLCWI